MAKMQVRWRAVAAAALVLGPVVLGLGRPSLERWLHERIVQEGRRHGVEVQLDAVRAGVWPPLALVGVRLAQPDGSSVKLDRLELWVSPRSLLGRLRLGVGRAVLSGRGGFTLWSPDTVWDVDAFRKDGWRAELREPVSGLAVHRVAVVDGARFEADAEDLPAGSLLGVSRAGSRLLDAGVVTGRASLTLARGSVAFAVRGRSRGLRLAALLAEPPAPGQASAFGAPTNLELALGGVWRPTTGELEVPRWTARLDDATLEGAATLADWRTDPRVDFTLEVRRVEFARLLRTSGVDGPLAVPAKTPAADLGSASLSAHAVGRLGDPASFTVTQRLDFTPPRELPAALVRLRGDFVHEVTLQNGERRAILVSPESPDFVPRRDVPPLFVRALLLAEDAGFYGHRGIDLQELPSALLTNWSRGGPMRGGSTLTQQLAKNLFLSRERRLGRKLQELPLALLLEATLDKERLLEIYLNVIEWGPDLYGLRPAARRYFDVEPAALKPAQMAFLVALIPGPIKYQVAFKTGVPTVGFRTLIDDLLQKLRSVGALSEQEFQAAIEDDLNVALPAAPGSAVDRQPLA